MNYITFSVSAEAEKGTIEVSTEQESGNKMAEPKGVQRGGAGSDKSWFFPL